MSRAPTPLEELVELLKIDRDGFLSREQLAEAIDALIKQRIEQSVGAVIKAFHSDMQTAQLGLIAPPTDVHAELRKAWGES